MTIMYWVQAIDSGNHCCHLAAWIDQAQIPKIASSLRSVFRQLSGDKVVYPTPDLPEPATFCTDAMHFRRCNNPACERPYQVNRFSIALQAWMEHGKITCPHCGTSILEEGGFVFLTHALSPKEEAEFEARAGSQLDAGGDLHLHSANPGEAQSKKRSFGVA